MIFSSSSNQSQHVKDEIYYAISEEKIILPFRIENLDPTGSMRLHLSSRHWLDAYQPSWKAHINRLIDSAADSIGHAPLSPAVTVRNAGAGCTTTEGEGQKGSLVVGRAGSYGSSHPGRGRLSVVRQSQR